MYNTSELNGIMTEYYFLMKSFEAQNDMMCKERALVAICQKYNMVAISLKENGSQVAIAEKNAKMGIIITVIEEKALAIGVEDLPKNIWNRCKRRGD